MSKKNKTQNSCASMFTDRTLGASPFCKQKEHCSMSWRSWYKILHDYFCVFVQFWQLEGFCHTTSLKTTFSVLPFKTTICWNNIAILDYVVHSAKSLKWSRLKPLTFCLNWEPFSTLSRGRSSRRARYFLSDVVFFCLPSWK